MLCSDLTDVTLLDLIRFPFFINTGYHQGLAYCLVSGRKTGILVYGTSTESHHVFDSRQLQPGPTVKSYLFKKSSPRITTVEADSLLCTSLKIRGKVTPTLECRRIT
jgi:hypothetical protein